MTTLDYLRTLPAEEIAPLFLREVAFLKPENPKWGYGEPEITIGYRYTSTLFDAEYQYPDDAIEAIIDYLNTMK